MTRRSEKVASLLREALSEIILYELNNPLFKNFLSITEIRIGGDLRKATVYFRVFSADPKEVENALNQSKGYIKKLLSKKITLKFMPDIEFKIDTSEEEERRLLELLEKIKKEK
ncbi:MAG: 30S ribosome-binding factor RbfA [Caldimicrobium sp.]|nr:30S ribosome-binding factor RbfA [Caldimicrobium sp.]MCX7874405.1 30S ribosome-binding factor RbfA [Caldimicrobium sp.]MDW8094010.1 30S ribosome-binding factor RbfA [Caldimicrobium sp.]